MVVRKFLSQKGNAMFMVVLAMATLAGGTYVVMKQTTEARKSVKSIAQKRGVDIATRKLKAFLTDRNVCIENFKGQRIDQELDFQKIIRNNRPVFQDGKVYQNGAFKVLTLKMEPKDSSSFNLIFEIEKLNAQLGGKTLSHKFEIVAETDSNQKIVDCYLNDDGAVTDAFEEAMNKICNGPGVIPSSERCKVMEFDLESSCSPGQAVKAYTYDAAAGKLKFLCQDIVTQVGTANSQCAFGLKATATPGAFECFELGDIVDSGSVTVEDGANCAVAYDEGSGKIKLECGSGASCVSTCGPPPEDPATVCEGETKYYADSCDHKNACSYIGTDDCSESAESALMSKYGCFKGIWKKLAISCSTISFACNDSEGLSLDHGSEICCPSTPTATCADLGLESEEPTPPEEEASYKGCFLAGTEISLFNGERKNIEDISREDILMGTSGEPVRVQALISYEHKGPKYSINGSRFFVTGSHPFKTLEGWKAFDPELAKLDNPGLVVGKLSIGDALYTEKGVEVISSIDLKTFTQTVYNFQVDGKHEYIADGFQVHNKAECSCVGMAAAWE